MKSNLTIEQVRAALDLDPETGVLLWVAPQSNRVKTGDRAGVIAANGRRYVNLAGEKHMAHRLVWFHYYGVWPFGDVKQKDGDYDNCAVANLIEQTRQETATNRQASAGSKSGHVGVTWSQKHQKWQVHITRDYKQVFIGLFQNLDDAVKARAEASASNMIGLSGEQRAEAAHAITRRRRQRAAWAKVNNLGLDVAWPSFEAFAADAGDVPETKMAILAIDPAKPIGPNNWRWSLPPDKKHNFQTREGRVAYGRAHREANPDLYRDKELRKKFGIGLSEHREMENSQHGVCAICGKGEVAERWDDVLALAVDHDHDTGKLRELLCIACNTAIGKFHDDPRIIRNAVAYLEHWGKREPVWSTPVMTEITHLPIGQKILLENRPNG